MPLTVEQAYAQIKALEAAGQLSLPQTIDTVEVGTIDAVTGAFTYAVETVTQTYTHPPLNTDPPSLPPRFPPEPIMFAPGGSGPFGPGGPMGPMGPMGPVGPGTGLPDPPLNILAGIVRTSAVDLRLRFKLTGVRRWPLPTASMGDVSMAAAGPATRGGAASARTTTASGASAAGPFATGGVFAVDSGVTIAGFPTIVSTATEIVIDAGLAASRKLDSRYVSPGIEIFPLDITAAGVRRFIHIMILRPPVLGVGAFTIPALPITVIYAPPQGRQARNSAQFSDVTTVSRSLTSSIKTEQATKRVQAYSASELVGKITGAIEQAAEFAIMVAARPAPGEGGAAPSGGGSGGSGGSSASDTLKDVKTELNLISTILNGLGDQMSQTDSTSLTSQSDQTLTVSCSSSSMYGSQAALGPGVGDRFVYMSDVRVVWMALNGEVGIHVLGFQAVKAVTAQGLRQDQQALAAGGAATVTGLDAESIGHLLALDPFCVRRNPVVLAGPAPVSPPRFVPAVPPERAGEGTGSSGDQVSISYAITAEDKQVRTNVQTTVKEVKPGWLDVVFGADNVATTSTFTFTVSQTADTKVDDKITYSATFVSEGTDDPYDVFIFYDRLFGSMLFAPRGSSVLQGGVLATDWPIAVG